MIVYLPEDRIRLKIGDIEISVAPLSSGAMDKLSTLITQQAGEKTVNHRQTVIETLRYGVKDLRGVKRPDGSDLKLEFEGDGLTDSSVDVLMRLGYNVELVNVATKLMNSLERELGEVEGIEVKADSPIKTKKKG